MRTPLCLCSKGSKPLVMAMLAMMLMWMPTSLFAQQKRLNQPITIKNRSMTLQHFFDEIRKQTGLTVFFSHNLLDDQAMVTLNYNRAPLSNVLDKVLTPRNIAYSLGDDDSILLRKRDAKDDTGNKFTISGTVYDEKGKPIEGATVQTAKDRVTVSTDVAGHFSIASRGSSDSLFISFLGYSPFRRLVGDQKIFDVRLSLALENVVDEVVVVGFGEQKKITTIGAQSSVRAADLKQPVSNISNLLAGRIAGIVGVQRSGEPGHDNSEIYIRGISTFTGSGPLVLVDGVERSFNNIDPEDIESFSILKDASATAVYGVRGANGVILIQLKKGVIGRPRINVQYDQGITQFTNVPKFADGVTYMEIANEAYRNSNPNDPNPIYSATQIENTRSGIDPDLYPNVDWFSTLFKNTGGNRRARVNASGGAEKAQYYLSVGYYDEAGLYRTDDLAKYNSQVNFTRFNFTSNLNLQVTKNTKVDFGASGWISDGNYPGVSASGLWSAAYNMPPILIPAIYSDGTYAQIRTGDVANPYNLLTQSGYVTQTRSQLWSNVRVTQELDFWLEGLSATGMFSFDNYNTHDISRTKTVNGYLASGRDEAGNLIFEQTNIGSDYLGYSRGNGGTRQYYAEAAINYARAFGKHDVSGLLLYNQTDRQDAFAGDFIGSIPFRFMGIASRGTYAYDNKYMVELNFGYNGSETFAPGHRFGFFPSYGLGWVASNEAFFKPLSTVFQFAKVRASYGIVGNSSIGGRRFAYISTVGGGNGGYSFGQNNIDNSFGGTDIADYAVSVTWEEAAKFNVGLELKTLGNRLSIVADYFRENRTGIFRNRGDVPQYAGLVSMPQANLGAVDNHGVDLTLDYNHRIGTDWSIGLRGNFTWNRATVINDALAAWPYPWQQRIGRKLGQRFGYTALGLFASDEEVANSPFQSGTNRAGDIKYQDLNGDGRIDSYDEGPIGYGSIPEVVYGFGPTLTWRNWSIAAWFKGISNVDISVGGDGFRPFSQGGERGNLLTEVTDRWTPENNASRPFYPRLTYGNDNMNFINSDWWLKNGSFMRLQTLQLNYALADKPWLARVGVKSLDLYFIGYNLATFSGFDLWDVELGDGRGAAYPLTKTYNLGLRFVFN